MKDSIKKVGRPRKHKKRVKTYLDIDKVKNIYIKNNPDVDPSTVTVVFIHALLEKMYPDRCPTYQTIINLRDKTGKQFDVFACIKELVGAEYIDDLLTTPK